MDSRLRWRAGRGNAPLSLALAVAALALLLPPAAHGSTAAFTPNPDYPGLIDLVYSAAPGETNALTASWGGLEVGGVKLSDPGAAIAPGKQCAASDPHVVTCAPEFPGGGFAARLIMKDGDDSAAAPSPGPFGGVDYWFMDGGPGNDRLALVPDLAPSNTDPRAGILVGGRGNDLLSGAESDDQLDGGSGDDVLHGGGGTGDRLDGGGGRDQLYADTGSDAQLSDGDTEGAVDADTLDGGGRGAVDYSSRTHPVYIDLRSAAPDGEADEGDILIGVGSVATGKGNDRLAGTAAAETLDGGPGADVIMGRGGDDHIRASGADRVSAGTGNDFVLSSQGSASIRCGPGEDTVEADPRGAGVWLGQDCERLYSPATGQGDDPTAAFVPPRPVRASAGGRLVFRLPCILRRCHERLTLTQPKPPFKALVSRSIRIREGSRPISISLPGTVAARARRSTLRLRVHLVTARAYYGADLVSGWRFDLKLPVR